MSRCLVVDDSGTMRRILRNGLTAMGIEHVAEASNGCEALHILQQHPVDFVVTDWNMPGMNGLELVLALRQNPATARLPVLMVTSNTMREAVQQALQAGVDDYMVKPFTMERLRDKVSALQEFASSLGRSSSTPPIAVSESNLASGRASRTGLTS